MPSLFSFLQSSGWQSGLLHAIFGAPLALILADLLTGASAAVKNGVFQWKLFANFLGSDLIKYLGGGLTLGALSTNFHWSLDSNLVASLLTMLGLSASVLASIISNLKELLPASAQLLATDAVQVLQGAAQAQAQAQAGQIPPGQAPPVAQNAQAQRPMAAFPQGYSYNPAGPQPYL